MAPARKPKIVEDPPQEDIPAYALEPLDEVTMEKLKIWGNMTLNTINQIQGVAPGWAAVLQDIFAIISEAVRVGAE